MEENLHKDNLEEFFKNSFDDENIEPSNDQWDVPSDSVWAGIDEVINPPAKKPISTFNFKGLMAIAAGILILGLLYYNYTLQSQVNELKEQVENYSAEINDLKAEKTENVKSEKEDRLQNEETGNSQLKSNGNNIELSNTRFENVNSENNNHSNQFNNSQNGLNQNKSKNEFSKPKSNRKDELTNDPKPENSPDTKSKKKKDIAVKNSIPEKSSTIIAIDDSQSNSSISQNSDQKLIDPNSSESQENAMTLLIPLSYKSVFLHVNNPFNDLTLDLLPISDNVLNPPVLPKFKPGFYLGAHIAPTYTYRNIKSVDGPVLRRMLNEKERAVYSVALGLKVGFQFAKNWSVETGLNYYKNTIQSMHLAQVQYQSQLERLNSDGNYDSNYHLNLSTSYGEIVTDVALTRNSDSPIDQNAFINLGFKTRQELKYLGVPIALRYRTNGNKFHFSAKAGISGNFIIQKDVTIKAATVNRNGVRHRRTIVEQKFSGLKNNTFDFLFGIGADYDISKNMSIYFEPTIVHSINPVYSLNGKIKTYPIVVSLNLGLSYRF